MRYVELNGDWRFRAASKRRWSSAVVPGSVYTDLLHNGAIDDPLLADNVAGLEWVAREEWLYEREFTAPRYTPGARITLCCDGLDTLATISLNGVEVGRTDNMHRTWRFDIGELLHAESNLLTIQFASPLAYIEACQQQAPLASPANKPSYPGSGWLRKMTVGFGSEWAPRLPGCGIWRNIGIEVCETARIEAVAIRQLHDADGTVALEVAATTELVDQTTPLTLSMRLTYKGTIIAEARERLDTSGTSRFTLPVRNAQKWWPNGMGEQPLYELVTEIGSANRKVVASVSRRLGLRTLRLERQRDDEGESFQFVVNGLPLFAKGANWVPPDPLITRPTRVEYARLIKAASVANFNMLRVWGGGIYEYDWFYDLCDEYGICVWQDFMFADTTYPLHEADWLANVREEASDNICRLRHHACLALWCGNSALAALATEESAADVAQQHGYRYLFEELLPSLLTSLAPDHDYWPTTPHTPLAASRHDPNHPGSGDAHLWGVGAGREPFQAYRTSGHRFITAFGFPVYPDPATLMATTGSETIDLTAPAWQEHQRIVGGDELIYTYGEAYFPPPKDNASALWLSQIMQGYAIKTGVEHWRRMRPRCSGTLYWQLNDCWPAVSWASLDMAGNWKALHYFVRRFYAPILISALENTAAGVVDVYVHNDLLQTFKGSVRWRVGNTQGHILRETGRELTIAPASVHRLGLIKVGDLLEKLGPENLIVWLSIVADDGYVLSTNVSIFCRPRQIKLFAPDIEYEIRPWDDHCYAVTLVSARPAFWCWLEVRGCPTKFDDNFVHLSPGQPCRIRATPTRNMKLDEFREALVVRSVWDLID